MVSEYDFSMNIPLILRTVRHLKMTQVVHQILYRLHKHKYVAMEAPLAGERPAGFKTEPIARWTCIEGKVFTFLNLKHEFAGWNFTENGMLWAYNQNYMDWLNQEGISKEDCCHWIDRFIGEQPQNRIGLDPYPIALRSINWIKFFCRYPETATKERLDSLYSQVRLLEKKLEYHLLGNHLLEDAFALYIAGAFFGEVRLLKKAKKLLLAQLKEQVLPDGAHYEQSPMYHCILLDRLLDCINIGERMAVNGAELRKYAERMLGHLESIVWDDGSFPMFNDSANGIAPLPLQIIDYAKRLNIKWEPIPMKECGYRKMMNEWMEAIVDVGDILASYQPGHSHADTFNFELRADGKPFIVDTGISTYEKNKRRQQERSSDAHNTVVVDGKNSSEVWGGFRIGKRAKVTIVKDTHQIVSASHNGFGQNGHRRTFKMDDGKFVIIDETIGEAIDYLHFAPDVTISDFNNSLIETDLATVELDNVKKIEVKEEEVNTAYYLPRVTKVAIMYFDKKMEIKFKKK